MEQIDRRHALGAIAAAFALAVVPDSAMSARADDGDLGTRSLTATSTCGPQVAINVPFAFALAESPAIFWHTHTLAVTLAHGTLADGQTVTVVGATSGVLQSSFPQHTHQINSTGVLGAPCGFRTTDGEHPFTLHAANFIKPS